MTRTMGTVRQQKYKIDAAVSRFAQRHPVLGYLSVFIGAPLLTLLALFAASSIVMLPVALLCGWL